MPGIGRRERNKRDKLNRIVGAARALFQSQGYADTTTQQIATAASIAAGTLFLYAKSKEDLVVLVFIDEMNELVDEARAEFSGDTPLLERVGSLFRVFIDYHARDTDIARVLIRELTFLSNPDRIEAGKQIADAIQDKLTTILEDGKRCGLVRKKTDSRRLSRVLFSIYYQQLQSWLSGFTNQARFEHNLTELLEFVLDPHGKPRKIQAR